MEEDCGDSRKGRGCEVGRGSLPWQARMVTTVGRCGEEEDQLEGFVEDGSESTEFYHQSYIRDLSNSSQSSSVAGRRPRVCPLFTACKVKSLSTSRPSWKANKLLPVSYHHKTLPGNCLCPGGCQSNQECLLTTAARPTILNP